MPFLSSILLACVPSETGIDSTTLIGTAEIPPGALIEGQRDLKGSPLDTILLGQDLGTLSWRYESVSGLIRQFHDTADEDNPADSDYLLFSPAASGTFTITFHYGGTVPAAEPLPDTAEPTDSDSSSDSADSSVDSGDSGADSGVDTGPAPDALLYDVFVYDLSQDVHIHDPDPEEEDAEPDTYESSIEPLAGGSTQGANGTYTIEVELEAGGDYALGVLGMTNADGADNTYTVTLSGSSPENAVLMIGAYADASDYMNKGELVAGAEIRDWVLDEETKTWVGSYEMVTFKTVESEEGQNAFGETVGLNSVNEGPPSTLYLVGGDFKNLNQGLPAGTLHNSASVEVAMKADAENTADAIVIDALAPKVIGWEFDEEEPNDFLVEEGEFVDGSMGGGTVLPFGSGLGFVDVVRGTMEVTAEGDGGTYPEETENDVFILTVEEELDVQFTTSWGSEHNFDMTLYDGEEEFIGSGYQLADVNPEVMPLSLWEVTLLPGETYYLVMQTWTGPIGSADYTIELEWLSP